MVIIKQQKADTQVFNRKPANIWVTFWEY